MIRTVVVAIAFGLWSLVSAQGITYAEVKAKSGTRLSAAELKQLMPGAKAVSRTAADSADAAEQGRRHVHRSDRRPGHRGRAR